MVGAGLQRGEQGRPPGVEIAGLGQRHDFGVRASRRAVAPSKTCAGSWPEMMTQPTHGFGAVVPRTESATATA